MIENPVDKKDGQRRSWLDFLAVILSFFGAIVSFWGALVTYFTQAQIPEASLWPLPGLILIDWGLLGLVSLQPIYAFGRCLQSGCM
jgi:hypothetical protein